MVFALVVISVRLQDLAYVLRRPSLIATAHASSILTLAYLSIIMDHVSCALFRIKLYKECAMATTVNYGTRQLTYVINATLISARLQVFALIRDVSDSKINLGLFFHNAPNAFQAINR